MVNFKPGEYMRKCFIRLMTQAYYEIAKFTTLRCVFLGESETGFVISDQMDSSPPKKTENPEKDQLL